MAGMGTSASTLDSQTGVDGREEDRVEAHAVPAPGLQGQAKKRYISYEGEQGLVASNVLNRQFEADALHRKSFPGTFFCWNVGRTGCPMRTVDPWTVLGLSAAVRLPRPGAVGQGAPSVRPPALRQMPDVRASPQRPSFAARGYGALVLLRGRPIANLRRRLAGGPIHRTTQA